MEGRKPARPPPGRGPTRARPRCASRGPASGSRWCSAAALHLPLGERRAVGAAGTPRSPRSSSRVALALIAAPLWWGLLGRLSDRARGADPLTGAGRGRGAPARLGPADPRAGAASSRRPGEVARLARRQERELRSWLPARSRRGPASGSPTRCAAAAKRWRRPRRDRRGGRGRGRALDHGLRGAGRRRARGAHQRREVRGRGRPVRLYAEIATSEASVWVDDRGPGFDPDAIRRTGAGSASR